MIKPTIDSGFLFRPHSSDSSGLVAQRIIPAHHEHGRSLVIAPGQSTGGSVTDIYMCM